jgi:hypothetical protein
MVAPTLRLTVFFVDFAHEGLQADANSGLSKYA